MQTRRVSALSHWNSQAAERGDPETAPGFHSGEMAGLARHDFGLHPFGQQAEGDDGETREQAGQQAEQGQLRNGIRTCDAQAVTFKLFAEGRAHAGIMACRCQDVPQVKSVM